MQFFKNIPKFKLTFFGINKLSSIIKIHKDTLLCCLHCDASYIEQTRILLKTKIKHIRRDTNQSFVITEHCLEYSHDFDWDKSSFWKDILIDISFKHFLNDPRKNLK